MTSDCPLPTRAYNMEILREPARRGEPDCHGWVFGLPPGIAPDQWPLDPNTGYPLMHGFTVLLPDEYRCHGTEIVALSFFAVPAEHNDGGTATTGKIFEILKGTVVAPPPDPDLLPYWKSVRDSHPRLHRMTDVLDCEYAVILLTQAEFDGPLCRPPPLGQTPEISSSEQPRWLEVGSGHTFFDGSMPSYMIDPIPVEELGLYKLLGCVPEPWLEWNRAIRCVPRAEDPNAGKRPAWEFAGENPDGYQSDYYYEGGVFTAGNFRWQPWRAGHGANHIGGTMRPCQQPPPFSPFYVEFEEHFGGYNFGGGNAQLDILNMKLDWACG